ncbi:MAG: peptidyl-prolyl cis-trans isomerase [Gammaproteobacteria bacterium]|jgi:peptidyl-prolyl cis-trans isomerase C
MSVLRYLFVLALLAGFSSTTLASTVVATVNGHKITEKQLDQYIKFREATSRQNLSHDKKAILEELVNRYLLMQEAKKKKLDKNKELAYMLKQQQTNLYIQALLRESDVAKPIPESEIKKIYDEKVKNHKLKEYKIRHILLKSEKAAKDAIAKLDKGANFAELAKKDSTGPSAKEGGELGWINIQQLNKMPNFARAIAELKKGKYTEKPVHTKYGWHVVMLQDKRDAAPPSLKEVRPQIEAALRRERVQQYVKHLRDKAKIQIHLK